MMEEAVREALQNGAIKHIAFIMDGNGRWATRQGLSRAEGHKAGAKVFEDAAEYCHSLGIGCVTVYAFSTENWRRPKAEVDALMRLFSNYIDRATKRFHEKKIRVVFLGDKSVFPRKLRAKMEKLETGSAVYPDILNIAFNYGARDEILHAVNAALAEDPTRRSLTGEDIERHLYTAASPDPDLIVRTAGELRLSNFLLWQAAYSEFYYTDVLWPDLTHEDIDKACLAFLQRKRNFGGVKETNS